jgi:type 1 glutamine amidotransferase
VLLRVRDGELDFTAPGARPPSFGYPLAWCFGSGDGRVFSTSLGHFPGAWESPVYLRHLSGGLAWALGEAG